MYFSDVPRGVDARPPARPEEDAASALSEFRGTNAGRTESLPPVSEKVQGKRAATDEPTRKKRKTAAAGPLKPGGISLGGDQTTRTRRTTVLEWSDDDETLVTPPPSTCTSAQHVRGGTSEGRQRSPQAAGEGSPTQQAMGPLSSKRRESPSSR